jgi:hypothetical protein
MNSRQSHFIISSLLLIVMLAACAQSPASAPSGSTGSPAAATSQPVSASASGGCTNAYFPTSSGTSWSYSSSGSPLGAYTYTWTVTDLSDTGFTTSDQYSTGVNATIKWNCQNGNLAALDAGSNSLNMTTSKVTMTSNSITAEGYNIPATFDTGNTWSEKVTVNGTVTASATKTVTSQIATQVNCTSAGPDTITVPAGKFDTVKATCSETVAVSALVQGTAMPAGAPVTESVTDWYAKGVGLVQSVKTGSITGTETIVLIQYNVQ